MWHLRCWNRGDGRDSRLSQLDRRWRRRGNRERMSGAPPIYPTRSKSIQRPWIINILFWNEYTSRRNALVGQAIWRLRYDKVDPAAGHHEPNSCSLLVSMNLLPALDKLRHDTPIKSGRATLDLAHPRIHVLSHTIWSLGSRLQPSTDSSCSLRGMLTVCTGCRGRRMRSPRAGERAGFAFLGGSTKRTDVKFMLHCNLRACDFFLSLQPMGIAPL